MDIYVGNIPKGTKPAELRKLLKDSVKKCLFRRVFNKVLSLGRLDKDVGVNILTSKKGTANYHYGHVSIQSDRLAQVAFDSIDGCAFHGESLHIRKFTLRTPKNDRRTENWRECTWNKQERRTADRRKNESPTS